MTKESDPEVMNNSITFLTNFLNDVNAFKLNKDIEAQQDVIESAEKLSKVVVRLCV